MVVQLLKIIRIAQSAVRLWLVIPAVEESLAVLRPRRPRELHPLDEVGEVLTRGYVAHMPLLPIRARSRRAIGQQLAIVGQCGPRKRDCAVGGERVRVEQYSWFSAQRLGPQQHILVLQAVVVLVEITSTLLLRYREAFVIPQL